MKKYCILLLLVFAAMPLCAQIVGDIQVERKVLRRQGSTLHLELDIRVGRHAVTRSQSWTIIPELSTADRRSVKLFPHVRIDGPYQKHMRARRRVLSRGVWAERQPYTVVDAKSKTEQIVRYVMEVPYESWMENATLLLRQIQTSPGDVRRVFTVDVNGAVETQE